MGQFQERGLIPPVTVDLFPHTVVRVLVICLCRFLKGYLVSKMMESPYITSCYFVFSSLIQLVYPQFPVGTSVFQYVVTHNQNLMSQGDQCLFLPPSPHQGNRCCSPRSRRTPPTKSWITPKRKIATCLFCSSFTDAPSFLWFSPPLQSRITL